MAVPGLTNCTAYSTGAAIVAESVMEAGRPWDGERGGALVRVPTHTHAHEHTHTHAYKMVQGSRTAALSVLLSAAVSLSLVKATLAAAESLTNTVTV